MDFFIRTRNRKNKKVKRSNTVCDSCSQGGTVRRNGSGANGQLKLSHSSVQTDATAGAASNNPNGGNSQLKERTKRRSARVQSLMHSHCCPRFESGSGRIHYRGPNDRGATPRICLGAEGSRRSCSHLCTRNPGGGRRPGRRT